MFEDKHPNIQNLLKKLSKSFTGKELEGNNCATCGKVADKFRDKLSEKEFQISRMCQECQDSVFV